MTSRVWFTCFALAVTAPVWAGMKPVAFRLASLPASAGEGQKLDLCAANIGTGAVDVTLEFVNVRTGAAVAEKTVTLAPLGSGAAGQPCLSLTANSLAASHTTAPMASSFAASRPADGAGDGEPLVVGVAMIRKPLLSFREAQVTASIQVFAPDANGAMRTVATIPLSRTQHPADGAPVYAPAAAPATHHK